MFKQLQGLAEKFKNIYEQNSDNSSCFLTLSLEKEDILPWFGSQQIFPQLFWTRRDGSEQIMALGAVKHWASLAEAEADELYLEYPQRRVYGGIAYTQKSTYTAPWTHWPQSYFFLPRWELRQLGTRQWLCLNLVESDKLKEIELACQSLCSSLSKENKAMIMSEFQHNINSRDWEKLIAQAQHQFKHKPLNKVVLSRQTHFQHKHFSPEIVYPQYSPHYSHSQAYRFWFAPQKGQSIFGVSPERLFARKALELRSEALAGTRPLPQNPQQAKAFREELLHSPKDIQEHTIVLDAIRSELAPFCSAVHNSGLQIKEAGAVQHLHTKITAQLHTEIKDHQILSTLHPTPAVNGFPTDLARAQILKLETHERGWYTGALGFSSKLESEWNVILRMGLLDGPSGYFYVGNGIVAASQAQQEWQELNHKLNSLCQVLGLRLPATQIA